MTVTIDGTTGIDLVQNSTITQTKLASNVAGTGPAFRAFINAATQTVTQNTWNKVTLTGETFDTNNCFDSTTNYRFTPNVAGYYQINGFVACGAGATIFTCSIYRNGALFSQGTDVRVTLNSYQTTVCDILYFNGSTDYVELYIYINGQTSITGGGAGGGYNTIFSGSLVRSA